MPLLTKSVLCAAAQDAGKDACQVMGWALPGEGGWSFYPVYEIPLLFPGTTVTNNHNLRGSNQHSDPKSICGKTCSLPSSRMGSIATSLAPDVALALTSASGRKGSLMGVSSNLFIYSLSSLQCGVLSIKFYHF